ncbi:PD-(D/E)XK nuclease family protein [Halorubrum vacuolatum]|uniref:ATP-dependent helicase/DNAse subunit B n=1 Tax=Halorubrum vacuolatum TaxID=63740 RepID=A0A238XDQ0_HALVU|nr:PD-(D/E)XK nuclease family protein [Halorubrum vacuolatum]SNR56830.1 ATP-dependent helicase/DNAse subunit B [Halorubrum vacuolatum]
MTACRLFSQRTPSSSRSAALNWAATRSTGSPRSVLYLEPSASDDDAVADQWESFGTPIELHRERFGTLVDTLYEADTYAGPATHVTDTERRWIVEEALTRIDDPDNPLYSEDAPSVGLITQAETLLTLLEFADVITSDEVARRLESVGLPGLARTLSRFVALVHDARADGFTEEKSFRSERFRHVRDGGQPLFDSVLSATDVVIIGPFRTLSPLERDVIGVLSETFDTGVALTRVTERSEVSGADEAIRRLKTWYDELGFTPHETSHQPACSARERAAATLYRHTEDLSDTIELDTTVSMTTYPSVEAEVRAIAKSVRSLIGSGVDPSAIVVAPFDEQTYADQIVNALRDAEVPVSVTTSRSFFTTLTGNLFEAAINLGVEPDRQEPLIRLMSNPLVAPDQPIVVRDIVHTADLLESTRVSTLIAHLDGNAEALIHDVVSACERFVHATDLDTERQALFDALHVPVTDGTLTDTVTFSRSVRDQERQAVEKAIEVCASLTERWTTHTQGTDETSDIEAVRRAFEQLSISTSTGRDSDSVRVRVPTEATATHAEYVFLPGLTTEHTPSPPRRLAFARPLNEAHPEFAAADPVAGMRYAFAQFIAGESTLSISTPEYDANGDPYVLADPLLELERITDLEITSAGEDSTPATRTDIHRSLAAALNTDVLTPDEIASNVDTYDVSVPGANAPTRLSKGVTVAAARAEDDVGEHDGQVTSSVVSALRDSDRPYSPSRLETYADCGFKYYLKYILKIEPDDEISLELNALAAGTYVHDVLERFYREWRDRGHDGVTDDTIAEAQAALYTVAVEELAELDTRETAFHDRWTAALFDGLNVPDNQYGDPEAAPGVFKRFLTAEIGLTARDATPTYFEAHVGLDPDEPGPPVIADDPIPVPGTDVRLRGKIDRLDVTPTGGIVGMDYKTGSTPSERDTIDGHAFQLPAYLLMAETALDGDPVGASYYQVKPTSSISPHAGTIGSEADAAHVYWGADDPVPLRRSRTLTFGTRDEFIDFLHGTVPNRIDRIATAIDAGSFHPTVLDPGTAGCEWCPYRDACDVRHHRRHTIHRKLTDANIPQYAPGLDTEDHQ